jgi:hypothetical protein
VSFWGTPNVVPAGSKMAGSCRFGAQGAMILGKKLPLARAWLYGNIISEHPFWQLL